MSLKLFRWRPRIIEVIDPSGKIQVMNHEVYVSKTIEKNRSQAERLYLGISIRRERDQLIEHVKRVG